MVQVQDHCPGCMTCAIAQGPILSLMIYCHHLEILKGVSCFCFASGPTNYVASPAHRDWSLLPSPFSFAPRFSLTLQTPVALVFHQFLEVVPSCLRAFAQPVPYLEHHPSSQDQLCSANFFLSSRSEHNYLLRDNFSDLPGLSLQKQKFKNNLK